MPPEIAVELIARLRQASDGALILGSTVTFSFEADPADTLYFNGRMVYPVTRRDRWRHWRANVARRARTLWAHVRGKRDGSA